MLTYESSVTVAFSRLHLLIKEPARVLDEYQVGNISELNTRLTI